MTKGKVAKWLNDNMVMLVMIPVIVGIHYGCSKLQEVPYLVDQSHRSHPKDMPIVAAYKALKNKAFEKLGLAESSSVPATQEK